MITVRELTYGGDLQQKFYKLRHDVLRAPLGLNLDDTTTQASEKQYMHIGLVEGEDDLLGGLLIEHQGDQTAKLSQMVVDKKYQAGGSGRLLVEGAEELIYEMGVRKVVLHARTDAQGFYEKLGYTAIGDPFEEVTIPHIRMEKILRSK